MSTFVGHAIESDLTVGEGVFTCHHPIQPKIIKSIV